MMLIQLSEIERAMIPSSLQMQVQSEEDLKNFVAWYGKIVEREKFPEHLISVTEKLKQFVLSPKKEETPDENFIKGVKEISKIVWPKYWKIKAKEKLSLAKEVTENTILKKPEVIKNISVGSVTDAAKIMRSNIKHYILSLVSISKSIIIKDGINHFCFLVTALNWEGLIKATSSNVSLASKFFDRAFAIIDEALGLPMPIPIIVHCTNGIERSPAIVIAYLMKRFKYTYQQAHTLLKKARPEITVENNKSLHQGLINYEENLKEKWSTKEAP